MLKHNLPAPILSPLMQNRTTAILLVAIAVLQGFFVTLDLPAWECPMLKVLGTPCPGCGLTRATLALFQGSWRTALTVHAFAPLLLLGFIVISGSALLPDSLRHRLIGKVEVMERRTGFAVMALVALLCYWGFRLLVMPEQFLKLLRT